MSRVNATPCGVPPVLDRGDTRKRREIARSKAADIDARELRAELLDAGVLLN